MAVRVFTDSFDRFTSSIDWFECKQSPTNLCNPICINAIKLFNNIIRFNWIGLTCSFAWSFSVCACKCEKKKQKRKDNNKQASHIKWYCRMLMLTSSLDCFTFISHFTIYSKSMGFYLFHIFFFNKKVTVQPTGLLGRKSLLRSINSHRSSFLFSEDR